MIELVVAATLACVSLDDADRFGVVGFHEELRSDDPRLVSVDCTEGECSGADGTGVVYYFWDGDRILAKEVDGEGPSASFRDVLSPVNSARRDMLSAPVCIEDGGVWVELVLQSGEWSYAIKAQP